MPASELIGEGRPACKRRAGCLSARKPVQTGVIKSSNCPPRAFTPARGRKVSNHAQVRVPGSSSSRDLVPVRRLGHVTRPFRLCRRSIVGRNHGELQGSPAKQPRLAPQPFGHNPQRHHPQRGICGVRRKLERLGNRRDNVAKRHQHQLGSNVAARTTTVQALTDPATAPSSSGASGSGNASTPGGGGKTLADCMGFWDKDTHMTKAEWRATCVRTLNGLDQTRLDASASIMPPTERRRR